jgi:hypothetical protein
MWQYLAPLALGGEQGGDVLEVAVATRLSLQADQIVEADGADADAFDDGLHGAFHSIKMSMSRVLRTCR